MKALISGHNIAYEENDKRGAVGKIFVPLVFTIGGLVFALIAIALATFGAGVNERWGHQAGLLYSIVYWPSVFLALAAVSWLVMSVGFSFYVANLGHYDKTYGALGAVIGFMTWAWLSSMVFLLGAELNSEIEHQTVRDTTTEAPQPIGPRGAVMADTVGKAQ